VELILIVVALILFVIFLLQNTRTIQVNFLVFELHIPTVILILVTMLVGVFMGIVTMIILRRRHKKALEREAIASRAPQPPVREDQTDPLA
jgi:uncharacterized integral membrane protein